MSDLFIGQLLHKSTPRTSFSPVSGTQKLLPCCSGLKFVKPCLRNVGHPHRAGSYFRRLFRLLGTYMPSFGGVSSFSSATVSNIFVLRQVPSRPIYGQGVLVGCSSGKLISKHRCLYWSFHKASVRSRNRSTSCWYQVPQSLCLPYFKSSLRRGSVFKGPGAQEYFHA